jgi:hypothetical protein
MIEIALGVVFSELAATLSRRAADEIFDHVKGKLVDKGVPKVEIEKLEELERPLLEKGATTHLQVKEFISSAEEISAHLTLDDKLDITNEALSEAHKVTGTLRSERLRQARSAFNAALVLAVLGVLIIFGGISLVLFKDATVGGAITAAVGAVVEVVSALLFKFSNDAQNRLDDMGRHLNAIEAAQVAVKLIGKIEDPAKRDDAIRETVGLLLGLGSTAPKPTS